MMGRFADRKMAAIGAALAALVVGALMVLVVGGTAASACETAANDQCIRPVGPGLPISRAVVMSRVQSWAARDNIGYDENGGDHTWDPTHTLQYRADCSGTVDMAWFLSGKNKDANTSGLTSKAITTQIKLSDLLPGDILDDTTDYTAYNKMHPSAPLYDHAVIFAGWANSAHTQFSVWTFGDGTFSNSPHHHETNDTFAGIVAGHPGGDYKAYRYNLIY